MENKKYSYRSFGKTKLCMEKSFYLIPTFIILVAILCVFPLFAWGGEANDSELEVLKMEGDSAGKNFDYLQAYEKWKEGYQLAKARKNNKYIGIFSNYLGVLSIEREDFREAEKYLTEALLIFEARLEYEEHKGKVLLNLGVVKDKLGEFGEAEKHYKNALNIFEEKNDLKGKAKVLIDLGILLQHVGLDASARDYFLLAIPLKEDLKDPKGKASALINLGRSERKLGHKDMARLHFKEALEIYRNPPDKKSIASALLNLGLVASNSEEAKQFYDEAKSICTELKYRTCLGTLFYNSGVLFFEAKKYQDALRSFKDALLIDEELGLKGERWKVLDGLQQTYAKLSQRPIAIFWGKEAVNDIQNMRGELINFGEKIQRSFIKDKYYVYEALATSLIDEGRLWEAQQILDIQKEEELFDFLQRQIKEVRLETQVSMTTQERNSIDQFQALRPRIVWLGHKYEELLQLRQKRSLTTAEQSELERIQTDLNNASQNFDEFLKKLEVEFQQTTREQQRELTIKELKSQESFKSTLRSLGEGTVALYFLSTKERLIVIVTSSDASQVPFYHETQIGERDLNQRIYAFRQILQNPHLDPLIASQELYSIIFSGIAEDLKELNTKTILVYLEGALRYLPLSALHDGNNYLAEQYAIVLYTPAVKDRLGRGPFVELKVAGLGVSLPSGSFAALPAVPDELDGIVKENRADDVRGVLPGILHLDQYFTKKQLSNALRNGFNVVHLASHFRYGGGTESESYFLLGGGDRLTLSELRGTEYPLYNVELLTLSACETGISGPTIDGQTIEGLGALAQERGAKSVLATLWEVADHSTGIFMQLFYKILQEEKLTKSHALKRAQEMFIREKDFGELLSINESRAPGNKGMENLILPPNSYYAHPYFWAPFILMGNSL